MLTTPRAVEAQARHHAITVRLEHHDAFLLHQRELPAERMGEAQVTGRCCRDETARRDLLPLRMDGIGIVDGYAEQILQPLARSMLNLQRARSRRVRREPTSMSGRVPTWRASVAEAMVLANAAGR